MHAEADQLQAQLIRQKLERSVKNLVIVGSWSISSGDVCLSAWDHMYKRSTTVLVLVSRALCSEQLPILIAMSALIDQRQLSVVPVFLENIPDGTLPVGLNTLQYRQGVDVYKRGVDDSVAEIARHTSTTPRYVRETASLERHLRRIR